MELRSIIVKLEKDVLLVTLKEHPKNPRIDLSQEEYKERFESLKRSMEKRFFDPVKADINTKQLLAGHQRIRALKEMGVESVDVLWLDPKDEKEAMEVMIQDNNEWGKQDWDKTRDLIKEFDINVQDMGFDDFDLTQFEIKLADPDENDDVVPIIVEPKSQLGDIYQLGKHKLMCGDATKIEDVEKLMGDNKADMVFTDPPYNVNYKGQGKNTSNKIMNDHMAEAEFDKFLNNVFKVYRLFIKDGGGTYVFHSTSTQAQFEKAMENNGFNIKNQLIWNKPMAALGWGDYRWKHEPFYYAGTDKGETKFYGDRTNSTVIDFQKEDEDILKMIKRIKKAESEGKTTIWSMKRDNVNEYVHPTQKPVELITYALRNSSKEEDIVLDLFGGSGSTMIACEKMNRVCRCLELDPIYVDTIIKRWEDFTHQTAKKLN